MFFDAFADRLLMNRGSSIFEPSFYASLAQLVERFIRNEQVVGSSPMGGSIFIK